jgi:hypothetical protein
MYTGITLCPMIVKLFEKVLLLLYENDLTSDPLQFGFKKDSSCYHAIFTFKETTRYLIKKNNKMFCAFLYASKAFDKVLHNGLFLKLLNKKVPMTFVAILKNWYSKLSAAILWNGVRGPSFFISCGVRQGGVLSLLLFAIYVDDLITKLRNSGYGAYVGRIFEGCLLHADDFVLISCTCHVLGQMLEICNSYGITLDLKFNSVKSQLLTIGGE